ncbi:MAG: bifunctional diaminohydroxyphosphoribosylaminopyrimidine deaminase/5-amino-6-(5-phosphoribosylamino)uracil reductase RibD [Akkermansiaceae bacterium]|nr:bifunctional diaminohydroxyphosphoribosylaminopyrimidine deaminase/5-amino-6-(5-phosphoribosylamino)uracil reductase RibD [Armatimonadota bacterium]
MRRALTLAKRGKFTHPNPKVGAVIVKDGEIIGEGWHVRPGTPHAEAMALAKAGENAQGATIYVTLEPCAHRQNADGSPRLSCAERCVQSGITHLVCAMQDPDTRTSGRGFALLRDAGVETTIGISEAAARALNRPFIKHRETGLPYVLHKAAMTLDGKIATVSGASRWITGEESRAYVHRTLRNTVDAVVVGVGTVLADDPSLTVRTGSGVRVPSGPPSSRNVHTPLRVVLDSGLRIPSMAKAIAPGTVIYAADSPITLQRVSELTVRGAEVVLLPPGADGRVDLTAAMRHLASEHGALSLLLESGGELAAGFYAARLVDTALFFVAPKLVGGRNAPTPIGGDGLTNDMNRAYRTGTITVRRFGADIALYADIVYDNGNDE